MTLTLDALAVDLDRRRIVEDITLEATSGTFTGLLGPNGSGKSTVLRAVYRAHPPSAGRVLVDDQDLLAMPARAAARRLAVVPQEAPIEFDSTVRALVEIGRHPHQGAYRKGSADDRDAVDRALASMDLTGLANRSVLTLSGGERQRVHVARALAQGCDHLLLDEPTNHLDVRHQLEVLQTLAAERDRGTTVVAALHDLGLAALFCDVVHLMHGGRIVASGPPADVITTATIRDVYSADVDVVPHPQTGTPYVIPRRALPGPPAPQHPHPSRGER